MGELSKRVGGGGTPAKKAAGKAAKKVAKKAPAKKAAAEKAPAKKAAKKSPAKKAVKKAAKKAPGKKAAPHERTAKSATMTAQSGNEAKGLRELPAPPTDPLVILGLDATFGRHDLRRAWRAYATRHHPDQGGDGATFARGRAAYDALRAVLGERR
jgi:hypothetical protein